MLCKEWGGLKAFLEDQRPGARAGMEGREDGQGGRHEGTGRKGEGRWHVYPVPLPDPTADRRPARVLRGTFTHTEVEV